MNRTIQYFFLLLALLWTGTGLAQNIRVQGQVTCDGEPVAGVNIIDTSEKGSIGLTDEGGNFLVIVPRNAELKFSHVSYQEEVIQVNGRQEIHVKLKTGIVELAEVTIETKVKDKVIPEPTDIEIQGNHFHLRTRFPVPASLFGGNTRLVIQPSIYDLSTQQRRNLRPMVFDGKEYTRTQQRMYDYDLEKDPLKPYLTTKTTPGRKNDLLSYHDSIYVEDVDHDYRADVLLSLENYNRIIYTDSFTIARGTVNPMRLLEYKLPPIGLRDSSIIPRQEMQMRDSHGEIQLTFLIGKTQLDPNNPENDRNIQKLAQEIAIIAENVDATIKEVKVTGVSSPDGSRQANEYLAKQRAAAALSRIRQQMGSLARYVSFTSQGEVATWETVAEMLEADQHQELADRLNQLLAKKQSSQQLYWSLKRDKEFDFLAKEYLPRLRKVTYQYEYSIMRQLNQEEVKALYDEGKEELSRYEYYLLASYTDNDSLRAVYLEDALRKYDRFLYAANELCQIRIREGKGDGELLRPYAVRGAAPEILSNQMIALLQQSRYADALKVWNMIPTGACDPTLEAVVMALNGHYQEAEPVLCAQSPVNEVIFLLMRKDDKTALEKARLLDANDPSSLYLRAIAANRNDEVNEAMVCLNKAIELNPELLEMARIDGDVLDLLENNDLEMTEDSGNSNDK